MQSIPYTKPSITEIEIAYANDAIKNGWGKNCYEYIKRFESDFSAFVGSDFAIATSSCTGAIFLALSAAGIGRGDEVIVSDINWIATIAPIVHVGASPVFVDILPDTWCIDPKRVESSITKNTKAIIATHIYGNLCEMNELKILAQKYNLVLIEDAAEAFGSKYLTKTAGTMGDFGVFSFHGTKTVTTGEGGMLITDNPNYFEKALTLSNHGRNRNETKQFWAEEIGYKFKMSNLQAALGCAQLSRAEQLIERKIEIFNQYFNVLGSYSCLRMNIEKKGNRNSFWMPTIVFDKDLNIKREFILKAFRKQNIDARVFFWPITKLPMFEEVNENRNAYCISERGINLPSFHDIRSSEIEIVAQTVIDLLEKREC